MKGRPPVAHRARGLAEDADPFGISLTRTREKMLSAASAEQIRTVMQAMDQLLPATASPDGNSQTPDTQILETGSPSGLPLLGGSTRVDRVLLVSPRRLTGMPSNTRIGFQLEDREAYLSRMGKICLCDGDVVEVPRLSDVVQVLGAVQSPGPVFFNEKWTPKQHQQRRWRRPGRGPEAQRGDQGDRRGPAVPRGKAHRSGRRDRGGFQAPGDPAAGAAQLP